MIKKLGVNGMSSEDSDYDNPTSTILPPHCDRHESIFVVLQPIWRAQDLSFWLWNIDAYKRIQQAQGADTRGGVAAFRIHINEI